MPLKCHQAIYSYATPLSKIFFETKFDAEKKKKFQVTYHRPLTCSPTFELSQRQKSTTSQLSSIMKIDENYILPRISIYTAAAYHSILSYSGGKFINQSQQYLLTCEEFLFGAVSGHSLSFGFKQGFSWYPVVIPACN